MTTRLGLVRSTSARMALVVTPSSTSDGWNMACLVVRLQLRLRRDQLQDVDAVERPAVRPGHGGELGLRLGEGDVDALLAEPHALQQALQGQGRLPRAGVALDQVDPVRREAAAQDVVEPGYARRDQGRDGFRRSSHSRASSLPNEERRADETPVRPRAPLVPVPRSPAANAIPFGRTRSDEPSLSVTGDCLVSSRRAGWGRQLLKQILCRKGVRRSAEPVG